MRTHDLVIQVKSRSDEFEFIPFGDIHIGDPDCAEKPLRKLIKEIAANPNAYILFGGDVLNLVLPTDLKRFDFDTLPDWLLTGSPDEIREKLKDVAKQQLNRLKQIFSPMPPERILGGISGNHEYQILKRYNRKIHHEICEALQMRNFGKEAMIRITFKRCSASAVIFMYIRHGYGGGRTRGAEANKIGAMIDEWELAHVSFTGHTHTPRVEPPKVVLTLPSTGRLPTQCGHKHRWGGNWGCWVLSHAEGEGGYAADACYPARPMMACKAVIKPFSTKRLHGQQLQVPHIELRQITL